MSDDSPERAEEEWGNEETDEPTMDPEAPQDEEALQEGDGDYAAEDEPRDADAMPESLEDEDAYVGTAADDVANGDADDDDDEPARRKKKRLSKKGAGSGDEAPKRRRKSEGDGDSERRHRRSNDGGGADGKRSKGKGRGEKGEERVIKKGEKAMWDHVAGDDSEEDVEGVRTKEDETFIDDAGAEPDDRFGGGSDDDDRFIREAPQAEESDGELDKYFKKGKKRKGDFNAAAQGLLIEETMAKLEKVAEQDADANRMGQPAINKLKMLPLMKEMLMKKSLQREFLDRGVLTTLKNWLEPLPDSSLPNINIRTAILQILTELPIEVDHYERREQLKASGLGKVVMFLSRYPDETLQNRKLARDLVDMWSRPIFQKSTRYEDLKHEEERVAPRRTPNKKEEFARRAAPRGDGDDLDLDGPSNELRPGDKGYRRHARVPKARALDFVYRPESKVSEEALANKRTAKDDRHYKMSRKLQKLAGPKRKNMRAEKVSVEGRGLVKYI